MSPKLKFIFLALISTTLSSCGGGDSSSSGCATGITSSSCATGGGGTANILSPDCTGANCGAADANTYSGSGIGIWRFSNSSSSNASIDLTINGVSVGKKVTLLYSNGSTSDQSGINTGTLASNTSSAGIVSNQNLGVLQNTDPDAERHRAHDQAHGKILDQNKIFNELAARATRNTPAGVSFNSPIFSAPSPTPAVGDPKPWKDNYDSTASVDYSTTAQLICALQNGRKVVIWADTNSLNASYVSSANIASLGASVCGAGGGAVGGFDKLIGIMGDVWGTHSQPTYLISDSPMQDINIVIVKPSAAPGWAGYFTSFNSYNASGGYSNTGNSNQAVVFFVSAYQIHNDSTTSSGKLNYSTSTLIHEAAHMINFYQKSVKRGSTHETWLEETSAMLSEDVVAASFLTNTDTTVYNTMKVVRVPGYLATGGNVSYMNWVTLTNNSYNIGGAFGAFVNRKYGTAIMSGLVTSCTDSGSTSGSSIACMDSLITANGGVGFADEFTKMGVSVFGLLPGSSLPSGYGYPAKTTGIYSLIPIDLSSASAPAPSALTGSTLSATSHTYKIDTIAAGKTSWVRSGVIVPAGLRIEVIVK